MCTSRKATKKFEVNVKVQKGALRFREKTENRCWFHPIHVFIHCCHIVIVLDDYIVHSCYGLHWGSRFYKMKALGALVSSLEFCSLGCD